MDTVEGARDSQLWACDKRGAPSAWPVHVRGIKPERVVGTDAFAVVVDERSGALYRVAWEDGTRTRLVEPDDTWPDAVAVHDARVVWSVAAHEQRPGRLRMVDAKTLEGGVLAEGLTHVYQLLVREDMALAYDVDTSRILTVAVPSGAMNVLAVGGVARHLTWNATDAFWVDVTARAVMRAALDGEGLVQQVVETQQDEPPMGVFVSGNELFWVSADGRLMRRRLEVRASAP